MKVFCVWTGCDYEGAILVGIYSKEQTAQDVLSDLEARKKLREILVDYVYMTTEEVNDT